MNSEEDLIYLILWAALVKLAYSLYQDHQRISICMIKQNLMTMVDSILTCPENKLNKVCEDIVKELHCFDKITDLIYAYFYVKDIFEAKITICYAKNYDVICSRYKPLIDLGQSSNLMVKHFIVGMLATQVRLATVINYPYLDNHLKENINALITRIPSNNIELISTVYELKKVCKLVNIDSSFLAEMSKDIIADNTHNVNLTVKHS